MKALSNMVASLLAALFLFASEVTLAQSYAIDSDEGVSAEELFPACAFCHGPQAQGGPAVDAPPLAGMEAWYVERQLNKFKSRIRGNHPDDVPGLQMSIVSGMTRFIPFADSPLNLVQKNWPFFSNGSFDLETMNPIPERY